MEFEGVIGPTWRESTPWWPPEPQPPKGAPNVLLVVLDDTGYAQLGCYGSDIATPTIDRLANDGVRLANFHTTALCSPTRACLLTGRNHHRNAMARVADLAVGYPGYWGRIPKRNGFLSEILAANGYATYAVGKWHLTPEDETHMAAPRDTWPVARGFQRWYGFHGGETHQFVPHLFADNHSVPPPRSPDEGYHLSADLADRAIEYLGDLRAVDDQQRFFLYLATGACHSPHHAPREWIDRYRGHFDDGWDAWRERTYARQLALGIVRPGTRLAPRPPWVPAWSDLRPEDQKVAARFMECFAGFLSYTDAQLGRVLAHLEQSGELDDTLVILVSDNGASAEGGEKGSINDVRLWNGQPAGRRELRERVDELGTPTAHNNYPWGWTMAGNTPLKRWKREVHEGGIADPCIIRWPPGTAEASERGAIRHQFAHAIDVLPTVLELCGVDAPSQIGDVPQTDLDGISFAYALRADGADAPERHTTQYFEMLGSRAIYHDGWKAVTFKPLGQMYNDGLDPDAPFDDDVWELYDKRNDLSECDDRAAVEPERLATMIELWWEQARRNDVLPLDNRPLFAIMNPRPRRRRDRPRTVLLPFGAPVPELVAPNVRNRSHSIVARVDVPAGVVPSGVLLGQGSVLGGYVLYLLDGRLHYVHNHVGRTIDRVVGDPVVGPGEHELRAEVTAPGDFSAGIELLVDGKVAGEGRVAMFTPARFSITGAGMTCGYEVGPAISPDYDAPFHANVTIRDVVIEVRGLPHLDPEAEYEAIMSEQ
jgi:arylsulfatase